MRIAIIGPSAKFLSGISYYTWRLSNVLSATPVLFRDMLPRFLFPGRERVGKVETKIRYENALEMLDWYNPLSWILAVREVNTHDIVIFEWWTASVAHMYAFISLFTKAKVIVEMHEIVDPLEEANFFIRWYARSMRKWILNHAQAVVVHSSIDREKLQEYGNVVVIPHGLYDYYTIREIPDKRYFNILFFGLVRDYKGIQYLIEGFRKSGIPDASLIIAGELWDRIDLDDDIIHYDRYLNDGEIEELFSRTDVVVLPYIRASQSGVAHIAIYYGLPIIATPVGGLSELGDYSGMHYVPVRDSDAIARELMQIFITERGKRYPAPERLTWDSIRKDWEKLFMQTISG